MTPIHQDDYNAIGNQHEQVTGRINDMLIELQNHSYATGVERGKALAKSAPSAADTTPPTLVQTIHLGQPGVTVEPCLMLGPADDEVACLLFTAPGTEVRLTWPTQTQALAVLAAATGEQQPTTEPAPGAPLRYTRDGSLAECPCCGSLDVGGASDTVNCYGCGLTIKKPRPLQNAVDAWNTRARREHGSPTAQDVGQLLNDLFDFFEGSGIDTGNDIALRLAAAIKDLAAHQNGGAK